MKSLVLLGVTAALATMIGCGGGEEKKPVSPVTEHANAAMQGPEWVMKGSGAFGGDQGKVFHGVGVASGIKNHALAVTTADNRARAEISKIFSVYSASLMKDYMASTTAGDMSASSEEQHVENAIKTFSANTLSGVMIKDHWFHPDGSVYSLAVLDLEALTNGLDKMNELSSQVRDYVRKNAEKAHASLEEEENKRAAAGNK
jgi:hypothetical protein